MIEHFIPLKLTHAELCSMRARYARLVDLQTRTLTDGYEQVEYDDLLDSFGSYDWLIARIVNAPETF